MSKFLRYKIALPVAMLVVSSGSASAVLNCTSQPTCAELGYSKSSVDGCKDYIYCPFDTSYKKCVTEETDCAELGFTTTDKSAWCDSIVSCPTDSSYTLCGGMCSAGYAQTADDCGTTGSDGWTLGTSTDSAGCYQCTAKTCPSGYSTSYQSAANCGSSGSSGWTFTSCYAGDTLLGKCTAKSCGGPFRSDWGDTPTAEEKCLAATGVKTCSSCYAGDVMWAIISECTSGYEVRGNYCENCSNGPFSSTISGTDAYNKCMATDNVAECARCNNTGAGGYYFSRIKKCKDGYTNMTSSCGTSSSGSQPSCSSAKITIHADSLTTYDKSIVLQFVCPTTYKSQGGYESVTWHGTIFGGTSEANTDCKLTSYTISCDGSSHSKRLTQCYQNATIKSDYVTIGGKNYSSGDTITMNGTCYKVQF